MRNLGYFNELLDPTFKMMHLQNYSDELGFFYNTKYWNSDTLCKY